MPQARPLPAAWPAADSARRPHTALLDAAPARYTRPAVLLHWLVAALVLTALGIGLYMEHFPGFKHTSVQWNNALFWHGSVGALMLLLMIARLAWRATHRPPALPTHMARWKVRASHVVHGLLYALLFAAPVVGMMHRMAGNHPIAFFGLFEWPVLITPDDALRIFADKLHVFLVTVIGLLIAGHFAAVLVHRFIDRDGVAQRMNWR
ncbi:MAG TPA: cytochrome b [Burkholderiales bacterium]